MPRFDRDKGHYFGTDLPDSDKRALTEYLKTFCVPKERKQMAVTVPEMLKMSQTQLDDLFTQSPVGEIPSGEAKGTAIVAPGTTYTQDVADFINHFAWQGEVFDPGKGVLRNKILPFGLNAIITKVYKGSSWMDKKIASSSTIPRRSLLVHWVRDEIREVAPRTYLCKVYLAKRAWLISPWSFQLPRNQIVWPSEVP